MGESSNKWNLEEELDMLRGSSAQFARLYSRYNPILTGIARSYISDKEQSTDLVQDVFLKLWQSRMTLEIRDMRAYLFQMICNRCLDVIKRKKNLSELEEAENVVDEQQGEELIHARDQDRQLKQLIAELSPQCRTVFLLVRFENMKYREVAELLNLSSKTVENHMGRALKVLRTGLEDRNGNLNWSVIFVLLTFDFSPASKFFSEGLGVKVF